jgi:hypothetical protein
MTNKHDGVFTGETRTITRPDPAGIPPNDPRPEMVTPISGQGGMSLGDGWSGQPKVPEPVPVRPTVKDANRPHKTDVPVSPASSSQTTSAGYSDKTATSRTTSSGRK